jgi:hypothetical protein
MKEPLSNYATRWRYNMIISIVLTTLLIEAALIVCKLKYNL